MGLLSIFKRKDASSGASAESGASETSDAVRDARTRARRRLIGAVVLLVIGVIGFPLVFETRPRPIPIDIPIEIPKKDGAPALVMPPARSAATAPAPPPPVVPAPPPREDIITESPAEAGREIAPRPAPASAVERAAAKPVVKPATPPDSEPAPKPVARTASAPSAIDGARAKALLDAKPTTPVDGARFVVQVGAFAEADAARETRVKVEKLGLKTYTQVAQTPAGSRIRVRVGPFATRAEADAALAKARGAGITAVVLTL